MRFLALNLALAIVWIFLHGTFTFPNFLAGILFGFLALSLHQSILHGGSQARTILPVIQLVFLMAWRLLYANIQLARDILRFRPRFSTSIFAYRSEKMSSPELMSLGTFISLTPGTFTIDFDEKNKTLYIHSLYARNEKKDLEKIGQLADLIHNIYLLSTGREVLDA